MALVLTSPGPKVALALTSPGPYVTLVLTSPGPYVIIVWQVEDFSLVSFGTLNIQEKESVVRALRSIDKANGYCFGDPLGADAGIFTCAAGEPEWDDERVGSVAERYMNEQDLTAELGGRQG